MSNDLFAGGDTTWPDGGDGSIIGGSPADGLHGDWLPDQYDVPVDPSGLSSGSPHGPEAGTLGAHGDPHDKVHVVAAYANTVPGILQDDGGAARGTGLFPIDPSGLTSGHLTADHGSAASKLPHESGPGSADLADQSKLPAGHGSADLKVPADVLDGIVPPSWGTGPKLHVVDPGEGNRHSGVGAAIWRDAGDAGIAGGSLAQGDHGDRRLDHHDPPLDPSVLVSGSPQAADAGQLTDKIVTAHGDAHDKGHFSATKDTVPGVLPDGGDAAAGGTGLFPIDPSGLTGGHLAADHGSAASNVPPGSGQRHADRDESLIQQKPIGPRTLHDRAPLLAFDLGNATRSEHPEVTREHDWHVIRDPFDKMPNTDEIVEFTEYGPYWRAELTCDGDLYLEETTIDGDQTGRYIHLSDPEPGRWFVRPITGDETLDSVTVIRLPDGTSKASWARTFKSDPAANLES
jgi:hypothetical protein